MSLKSEVPSRTLARRGVARIDPHKSAMGPNNASGHLEFVTLSEEIVCNGVT